MHTSQTSQYPAQTGYRKAETGNFGGGHGRFPQRDPNAPKPEPKETGNRIWKLIHSYKVGETFANTTAVAEIAGGCLVRTATRTARGCAEALQFVPGATLADFYRMPGGAR